MVWYGVVWYGMVWYGMVWNAVVWCGMVWYCVVLCDMVWYGMVWCGMVWCGVVWYCVVLYGVVLYGVVPGQKNGSGVMSVEQVTLGIQIWENTVIDSNMTLISIHLILILVLKGRCFINKSTVS